MALNSLPVNANGPQSSFTSQLLISPLALLKEYSNWSSYWRLSNHSASSPPFNLYWYSVFLLKFESSSYCSAEELSKSLLHIACHRMKSKFLSGAEDSVWSWSVCTSLASSVYSLTILSCLTKLAWLYHPSMLFLHILFSSLYVLCSIYSSNLLFCNRLKEQ